MTFSYSSRPHPSLRNRFSRRVEWVFRRRMDQSGVQYGDAGSMNENEGRMFVIICGFPGFPGPSCVHITHHFPPRKPLCFSFKRNQL